MEIFGIFGLIQQKVRKTGKFRLIIVCGSKELCQPSLFNSELRNARTFQVVRNRVNKICLKLIKKELMKLDIITYIFSWAERKEEKGKGDIVTTLDQMADLQ